LSFIDTNYKFHLYIAKLAGNHNVVNVLADVMNQLAGLGYLAVARDDDGPQIAKEHGNIVQATRDKDRRSGKKGIRQHIQSAKQNILNVCMK
jgi:DNA-binding GntR family transcriptional regulator